MRHGIILAAAMLAGGLLSAAEPSFNADIFPLFQKSCVACHGDATASSGLKLNSYDGVMKGGKHGAIVLPGRSGDSRLVKMLEGTSMPRMPLGGDPLDERAIATIKAWIDAGAKAGEPAGEAQEAAKPDRAEPKQDKEDHDDKAPQPILPKVAPVAWCPDGSLVALGHLNAVELIDPRTKQITAKLEGHAEAVRALAFSPDGKLLAAASGVPLRSGEVKVWRVDDRQPAHTFAAFQDYVTSVAFSPDGRTLAAASYDGTIKLWDVTSGAEETTLAARAPVFGIAFNADGSFIASAGADGAVRVWDRRSGAVSDTLREARDSLYVVAWVAGGRIIAGGADGNLYAWQAGPGGKAAFAGSQPAHPEGVLALACSADGATALTSDPAGRVRQWDVKTLRPAAYWESLEPAPPKPEWIGGIAYSPSGMAAISVAPGTLVFHDIAVRTTAAK